MSLPEAELKTALSLNGSPLVGIQETAHEWLLGTISIGKQHASWRAGYSHPLKSGSRFYKQWFDLDNDRGWAVVFRPEEPPHPDVGDYFVGWVPAGRDADADDWIQFLNAEISSRLASKLQK